MFPSHDHEGVVIAWDRGVPTHRRALYSEYKSHKRIVGVGEIPTNLLSSDNVNGTDADESEDTYLKMYAYNRDLLHRSILPLLGCISIHVDNCEADDIIAVWTHHVDDEPITILSSDRDLYQLFDYGDHVEQYNAKDGYFITKDSIIEEYGITSDAWRTHWMIYRAILGDGSDGIPGIPQVGDVAAINYSAQLTSMLNLDISLEDALSKLERPPRARVAGLEFLQSDEGLSRIRTNIDLMDLRYIIDNDCDLYRDIKSHSPRS